MSYPNLVLITRYLGTGCVRCCSCGFFPLSSDHCIDSRSPAALLVPK